MKISSPTFGFIILAIIIANGVGLYLFIGKPSKQWTGAPVYVQSDNITLRPDLGMAANTSSLDSVDSMIARLQARLEQNPDDVEGWRMLGWSFFNLDRYAKAAEAYERAASQRPQNDDYLTSWGESLTMEAGGLVTDEAYELFLKALAINPNNPRANFFKGLRFDQNGDSRAALDLWVELVNNAALEDEWASSLRDRILSTASDKQIDISGRLKETTSSFTPNSDPSSGSISGPSRRQMVEAMAMPEQDRQAMIEGMVARLALRLQQNPDDVDGWERLIHSYQVMGRTTEATESLQFALGYFADDPEIQERLLAKGKKLGLSVE